MTLRNYPSCRAPCRHNFNSCRKGCCTEIALKDLKKAEKAVKKLRQEVAP
jgi:hypothetical protein